MVNLSLTSVKTRRTDIVAWGDVWVGIISHFCIWEVRICGSLSLSSLSKKDNYASHDGKDNDDPDDRLNYDNFVLFVIVVLCICKAQE